MDEEMLCGTTERFPDQAFGTWNFSDESKLAIAVLEEKFNSSSKSYYSPWKIWIKHCTETINEAEQSDESEYADSLYSACSSDSESHTNEQSLNEKGDNPSQHVSLLDTASESEHLYTASAKPQNQLTTALLGKQEVGAVKAFDLSCEVTSSHFEQVDDSSLKDDIEELGQCIVSVLNSEEPDESKVATLLSGRRRASMVAAVREVWPQLSTLYTRQALCNVVGASNSGCAILCRDILLPWICENTHGVGSACETVAPLLPAMCDSVVPDLILPLLSTRAGALVSQLSCLPDLMARLSPHHWLQLLSGFVQSMQDKMMQWQLPVLTLLVEHNAVPTDQLSGLIGLAASCAHELSRCRDYGVFVITLISSLRSDRQADTARQLAGQLTDIATQLQGPLKFKALNNIRAISELG